MPRPGRVRDSGFTLAEVLVASLIFGIMTAIALPSLMAYSRRSAHRDARDQIVSALRNSAERALSEGRTYCLYFSGNSWQVYRSACAGATATPQGSLQTLSSGEETLTVSFAVTTGMQNACPEVGACVYFYPRGNAAGGQATVARSGLDTYVIKVEGLTSRVYVA